MNISLNPYQVQQIAGKPIKVVKYSSLHEYDNIEQLFDISNYVLLLFETKHNNGLWVGLVNKPKTIYFFCSYGYFPDDHLHYTNVKFRKSNNMDYGYLSYLLLHTNKTIDYNDKQLQKVDNNINTCGRWVGMFFRLNKSNNAFSKIFMKVPQDKRDKLITELTNKYIV